MNSLPAWLEQAIFYQIYPQSYADSNGDGIGDLPGIIQKLDYIQSLGVNAIWINPCFVSPFQDAGYDVSDYYTVAPRYGTNNDIKQLFDEAKRRGIRVLLDLVPGHTSIEHPWFQESCRHERNEYSDWYVWTDSVWSWDNPGVRTVNGYGERDSSFVTNFFYCQPALNYGFAYVDRPWQQSIDAPGPQAVRAELRNIMRYWLEMGASGFRVDMAGSLIKNDPGGHMTALLWREMREWLDGAFPDAVLVAEWARPSLSIVEGGYHMDFCLPFGTPGWVSLYRKTDGFGPGTDRYGWNFFDKSGHGNICAFLDEYMANCAATKGLGHIAIPTGNHDIGPRLGERRDADDLELIFLFLMTMPGTPFIYYGDEIGMHSLEGLPSKEGAYGRTAVRTPMQWDDGPNAGFSTALEHSLYLPVDPDPERPTVSRQDADPESILNRVRRLTALRAAHPALCASGDFEPIHAEAGKLPFVYQRSLKGERIIVAINPADRPCATILPGALLSSEPRHLYGQSGAISRQDGNWMVALPGVSAVVYIV